MTETALSGSLREAVSEVLETMFFVEAEGQPSDRPPETIIVARVDFEGSPSGTFSLRISEPAANRMAADFLGEEAAELPPARTLEVVSELANMICGSLLSRVESETAFRLSPPSTAPETAPVVQPFEAGIVYSVQLPEGALSVRFLCHGAGL
jgi:CheY-specific phosphatase CheX